MESLRQGQSGRSYWALQPDYPRFHFDPRCGGRRSSGHRGDRVSSCLVPPEYERLALVLEAAARGWSASKWSFEETHARQILDRLS